MPETSKGHRPTIRDVAQAAGVSHQTVSRVLNDHPRVAPATRERVLRAMKKMGYQRNLAAQMLTTQRSGIVQVLAVDGNFPFEASLLEPSRLEGYLALYSECTSETLASVLDRTASRLVEGIFLYAPRLHIADEELSRLAHGIPIVRRDFALGSRLSWVGFDQVRAAQLALEHLLDLGHRQIAEVGGPVSAINVGLRHAAFARLLREHGLAPGPVALSEFAPRTNAMQTGYEEMRRILEGGQPFTAVMAGNDQMAIGVLHALRERGLRIPQDVSVIGCDDAPHARYLDPPLTTVRFDFELQNRLVFQFLFEHIRRPETEPHQHVLLPDLIVRQSTQPPA